jgi:hypothetical protein
MSTTNSPQRKLHAALLNYINSNNGNSRTNARARLVNAINTVWGRGGNPVTQTSTLVSAAAQTNLSKLTGGSAAGSTTGPVTPAQNNSGSTTGSVTPEKIAVQQANLNLNALKLKLGGRNITRANLGKGVNNSRLKPPPRANPPTNGPQEATAASTHNFLMVREGNNGPWKRTLSNQTNVFTASSRNNNKNHYTRNNQGTYTKNGKTYTWNKDNSKFVEVLEEIQGGPRYGNAVRTNLTKGMTTADLSFHLLSRAMFARTPQYIAEALSRIKNQSTSISNRSVLEDTLRIVKNKYGIQIPLN